MENFFICKTCGTQSGGIKQLIHHNWFKHRINASETVLEYVYDNVIPQCQCGCGEAMKYFPTLKDYAKWKAGHKAKVENFGNKEGYKKSKETRQLLSEQGLLKNSVETRKKKSIARQGDKNPMFGKTHTDKVKHELGNKTKENWLIPEYRNNITTKLIRGSAGELADHQTELLKLAHENSNNVGTHIYLLQWEETNLYKIGYTTNSPYHRLVQIQRGAPFKISLKSSFKTIAGVKLESKLHKFFEQKHKTGEWFELDQSDVDSFVDICEAFEKALAV
jgi:hypothetical protein